MEIILVFFSAASTILIWLCLKKLAIISRDTTAREDLSDTIDRFAALAAERKSKVVAFKVKANE